MNLPSRELWAGRGLQLAATLILVCSPPGWSRAADAVTFSRDVAPIVFQHCATCHRPEQSAPFNLLGFADVKKRARQIAEVVQKRIMPPWLPEKGYGEFADDRSLTTNEIQTIEQWVAQGAPEGERSQLPPLPKWTGGWRLGTPDLVITLGQPYVVAPEGKDVYRNFVVPIPVSETKFVKGVEFLPGNWKVVHHAFLNIDSTPYSRRRAEKSQPPGFEGMLLPETCSMPGGQFLGWQPGKVPAFAPEGLAWVLRTNTDLVVQCHLHPTGKPELLQPSVGFYFTDRPPTNAAFRLNLNPLLIDIPPGARDYAIEDKYVLPIDVDLIGSSAHAHYLGKRLEGYGILPGGRRQELLLIRDWNFNWQGDYRYAHPVFLPKGTTLVMHFTYDNSTDNVRNPNQPPKRVKYGLQTTDEMGELWFQVLPRNREERNVLARDFYGHLVQRTLEYNEHVAAEDPNDAEAHTRAGRARAFLGQVPQALEHFYAAVKANPNYDRAWYELGFIYLRQNKLVEAEQAFQRVIRLNPDDYEAQGSLGSIYLQRGDLNRAETYLRAALLSNPADAVARGNLERLLSRKSNSR